MEAHQPAVCRLPEAPRTEAEFIALADSFRRLPMTADLFRSGTYNSQLSPVIEVVHPTRVSMGCASQTACFTNRAESLWLVWDAVEEVWRHESRNPRQFWAELIEQPPEFVRWQEQLFDWIRDHWGGSIIQFVSYRLGDDAEQDDEATG